MKRCVQTKTSAISLDDDDMLNMVYMRHALMFIFEFDFQLHEMHTRSYYCQRRSFGFAAVRLILWQFRFYAMRARTIHKRLHINFSSIFRFSREEESTLRAHCNLYIFPPHMQRVLYYVAENTSKSNIKLRRNTLEYRKPSKSYNSED